MADMYDRDDERAQPPTLFPAYASTVRRAPSQASIRIPQTITETSGPADCWDDLMGGALADMTTHHRHGEGAG